MPHVNATYSVWQPLRVSDSHSRSFHDGWKKLHITLLTPQPDLISNGKPFRDIRVNSHQDHNYIPIMEPFAAPGVHLYLQEPFTILKTPTPKRSNRREFLSIRIRYEFDGATSTKSISMKYIDDYPTFTPNQRYPGIALPKYLARQKFTVKTHTLERLHNISELEASQSGIDRLCGGFYYRDYSQTKKTKPTYLLSALDSLRTLWDIQHKIKWKQNPLVWVSRFSRLGSMGKGFDEF